MNKSQIRIFLRTSMSSHIYRKPLSWDTSVIKGLYYVSYVKVLSI